MTKRRIRRKLLLVLAAALAFTGAVLLTSSFAMVLGQGGAESSITTQRGREHPSAGLQPIRFVVEGESPLAAHVTGQLQKRAELTEVGENEPPTLIVRLEDTSVSWTPLFARAEIRFSAAFSSDGDFFFFASPPYSMDSTKRESDEGFVWLLATVTLRDRGIGLISRHGYSARLADAMARELDKMVHGHLLAEG